MRRQRIFLWIIAFLSVFGIIDGLFLSKHIPIGNVIVPLAVVAIVFLLYKYPPRRYRKQHPKIKPSARTMAKVAAERRSTTEKRKAYPFQVIEGQKGKNDDDLPKYH
ncbi:hypothetical protein [Paenibacillus senegalimassiliensis]|uniref:hypothetical protein n=1 Tax=Paenibacillus senegalimassiliensis TaxID=1737426 RepID=UPI00073F0DC9|nr:hypothetical protein [Paenibacillus senegalimassiliensis]